MLKNFLLESTELLLMKAPANTNLPYASENVLEVSVYTEKHKSMCLWDWHQKSKFCFWDVHMCYRISLGAVYTCT